MPDYSEMTFPEQISSSRRPKYAIVGQGVMEDESLNSTSCCGIGQDKEPLIEKCFKIAERFIKDLESDDIANNVKAEYEIVDEFDGYTVLCNGHPHSAWTVVEIMYL